MLFYFRALEFFFLKYQLQVEQGFVKNVKRQRPDALRHRGVGWSQSREEFPQDHLLDVHVDLPSSHLIFFWSSFIRL